MAGDSSSALGTSSSAADASCHTNADCTAPGYRCLEPGGFFGCGQCHNDAVTCGSDQECLSSSPSVRMVCEESTPADCLCQGGSICKPGCIRAEDCAMGQECSMEGHCMPQTCTDIVGCPANFQCLHGGALVDKCIRKTCMDDSGCDAGACVNGQCFEAAGMCSPIPA